MTNAATYGKAVAVSGLVTASQFHCIRREGFDLVIVRVYRNHMGGMVDSNAPQTMRNAQAVGLHVEIYHFPALNKTGAAQFDEMYDYMKSERWFVRFVWFAVTKIDRGTKWSNSITDNRRLIQDFVDRAKSKSVHVGIHSKNNVWPHIVGDWKGPALVKQIWFWKFPDGDPKPHGKQVTTDFTPFGRWSYATMKRYVSNVKMCETVVDLNVYPKTGIAVHLPQDHEVYQA